MSRIVDHQNSALPVLGQNANSDQPGTVRDPVCGMTVNPLTAAGSVDHDGLTYHFCSRHCVEKFRADPARYLADQKAKSDSPPVTDRITPPVASPAGTTYTCPMHPQIVRDRLGSCPICGMALEPMTVVADADVDPELADMSRRLWICAVLTLPLLILSMVEMVPGWVSPGLLSGRTLVWIELILAAPVVLWGGLPFFQRGWSSVVHRSLNMFTLIALRNGNGVCVQSDRYVISRGFPSLIPRSPW